MDSGCVEEEYCSGDSDQGSSHYNILIRKVRGSAEIRRISGIEQKVYRCKDCSALFRQRCQLKSHRRVHRYKSFPCNFCGKLFSQRYLTKRHELGCLRPYLCPFDDCKLKFISKDEFLTHQRKDHSFLLMNGGGFMCTLCKDSDSFFSWRSCLYEHYYTVHNHGKEEKPKDIRRADFKTATNIKRSVSKQYTIRTS